MNYLQSLTFIENFIDHSRTHQQNLSTENFEIERMVAFLAALGNPHHGYPTVHVAGTKGKGSVSALCASVLTAAGYATGLYTSPHLERFNERIRINGVDIPDDDLAAIVSRFPILVPEFPGLTAYELQTALAFIYFAEQKVDIAVIEVGLGGRLDSTNVITPLVSVITSISLDHTFILGDTLEAIAGEKGGIIKLGVPVVTAPQSPGALARLKAIAAERDAPFLEAGEWVTVQAQPPTITGQNLKLEGFDRIIETKLPLLGRHQQENVAVAFTVLCRLDRSGFQISDSALVEGFAAVRWPGRFEIVSNQPPVILDGAHNRHSAAMLVQTLDQLYPNRPRIYLFGASADKDVNGMFAELLRNCHTLVGTQSIHPRALPVTELLAFAAPAATQKVAQSDVKLALETALDLATQIQGVLVATGSLYVLGEIRSAWFAYPSRTKEDL
jgi:dihydrofolate synthase/folylpolyglutamate synthase